MKNLQGLTGILTEINASVIGLKISKEDGFVKEFRHDDMGHDIHMISVNEFEVCVQKKDGEHLCYNYDNCYLSDFNTLNQNTCTFYFHSTDDFCSIHVKYQIEKNQYIKKQISVIPRVSDMYIKYVIVEECKTSLPLSRGGKGQPVFVGNDLFVGLEFPAALNSFCNGQITLLQKPGVYVNENQSWSSYPVVYGFNTQKHIQESFRQYIRDYHVKSKDHHPIIYCDWGLHDELSDRIELTESMTDEMLKYLQKLKNTFSIKFDYYLIDAFWFEENIPYIQFKSKNWPHGFEDTKHKMKELGIKLGLWFDLTGAFLKMQTMEAALLQQEQHALCLGHDQYFEALKQALIYHIGVTGMKMIKFDFAVFECSNPQHLHPMGEDSKEFLISRFLTLMKELRQLEPELIVLAYNGFTSNYDWIKDVNGNKSGYAISPWWALDIDYLYCGDPRPSEVPTIKLRDSIHYYTDAMIRQFHDALLPFEVIDDHGIMMGKTGTIYGLGKEGWRDNWILSLSRGNGKIHFYGDLKLFDESDVQFLQSTWGLFEKFCRNDFQTELILGNPICGEVYGYHNGNDKEGYITVVNPFPVRVPVKLDVSIGAGIMTPIYMRKLYEDGVWIKDEYGDILSETNNSVEVAPFSVSMYAWEVKQEPYTRLTENKEYKITTLYGDQCIQPGEALDIKVKNVGEANLCKFLIVKFKDLNQKPLRSVNGIPEQLNIKVSGEKSQYCLQPIHSNQIWSGISWMILDIHPEPGIWDDILLNINSNLDHAIFLTVEKWELSPT